jgi:putative nucleotidyltransferase with HDIG domain
MNRLAALLNLDASAAAERFHVQAEERALRPLSARERLGEAVSGAVFVAAVLALVAVSGTAQRLPVGEEVALIVCFAVVSRVEFDVGTGYTVPAQLLFVPMLFLFPPALVPLAVVAGFLLAKLPEVLRGQRPPSRMLLSLGDAWFAIGPAAVLALAGSPDADEVSVVVALGALAAQFATDFAASTCRELVMSGANLREQLREVVWIYVVDALLAPIGFLAALTAADRPWTVFLLFSLGALLRLFAFERSARVDQMLELGRAYRGTAVLLGDVVEADHDYTGSHSRDVVELATAVADKLAMTAVQRRNVEFGALLHDVGKIRIPKAIIDKPGPLDDDEWAVMRTHTLQGEAMLRKVGGVLSDVGRVVRSSHEHFDGRGYPDGLAGEDIPIEARVVCCCDAFSAMTTNRSYRRARPVGDAVAELRRCAGTQFDPAVVAALAEVLEEPGAARVEELDGSDLPEPAFVRAPN